MPDYPGVYVEEVSTRTREIAGVPTSTAAFVGFAPSGPTDPTIISGIVEYEAAFGKISAAQPMSAAVADFFRNGGTKAVILRVVSAGRGRTEKQPTDRKCEDQYGAAGAEPRGRTDRPAAGARCRVSPRAGRNRRGQRSGFACGSARRFSHRRYPKGRRKQGCCGRGAMVGRRRAKPECSRSTIHGS